MSLPSDALLSHVDRIYVINLAHRQDRRREIHAELQRIGLGLDHPGVTLFPASFPDDAGSFPTRGTRGCFESHLGVHRAILKDGVSRALLVEDDASLVPDFAARLAAIGDDLRRIAWDMLYSVKPLSPQGADQPHGAHLLRLSPEHTFPLAHFVGFSAAFCRLAVPYLEAIQARPFGHPDGGPMHVDGAYCWMRAAYPDLTVIGTRMPLAVQRPSRSDIASAPFWDRLPILRDLSPAIRRSPLAVALVRKLRGR